MNCTMQKKSMVITTDYWTEAARDADKPIMEYGIRISSPDEPPFEMRRISDDRIFVEKLALVLMDPDVASVHYSDIVEDAVSELTMNRV